MVWFSYKYEFISSNSQRINRERWEKADIFPAFESRIFFPKIHSFINFLGKLGNNQRLKF